MNKCVVAVSKTRNGVEIFFLLLQTYWAAVKAYVSIRSATVGLYKRKHMSASFCTISKNSLQLFNKLIFEMPNNT